ncbi:DUF4175 domain-containing protein [Hyphomonas johnsonii]|uniref:TIGR02302 family protein n=1 Tax=Hyphomonas johnsonii MHS-2 TaxID=1280950 RepID=A0A059FNS3_9PROT|nr:DUF4175 family protein [Hyphomonas johnsonii]KCZ92171.1 hypothetical protein HJO_09054 [Hyphomonas johnsonii MHS-2]
MADADGMKAVNARVSATWRNLTLLALGQAFWPLFVFVCLFLSAALVGLFDRVEPAIGAVMTLVVFVGSAILLFRGLRRYRPPTRAEASERLDRQSDLRPLTSLADRPADPTRGAQRLWASHRARLMAELKNLRPPSLSAAWKALDPFLLRAILPLAVVAFAVLASSQAPGRVLRALSPDYGALVGADDMVVEAWITPPEHTGRAPIFLKPGLEGVRVPKGSEVTLRTEAPSAPRLVLKGKKRHSQAFVATPDGAYEAKAKVMEDTRLSVDWWGERAAWKLLASPDDPPTARFVAIPSIGTQDRIEFTWGATDDYGVKTLELAISLREPNPAAPAAEDRVSVPLPGVTPTEGADTVQLDLTRHRWAGLPVNVRLIATDGAGQEGTSETVPFILPEKLFLEPVARVAQEVRVTVLREPREYAEQPTNEQALQQDALNTNAANRLATAPPDVQKAALMLDAVTLHGERYMPDIAAFLTFRTAEGILRAAGSKAEADAIDPLLWALALKSEYGSSADALRRLEAARRALEQALRDGASEEEIKRRMEAFRDAANNYLAAKMAEAMANGLDAPPSNEDGQAAAGGPNLGGQDFEDMLQALQDLTETGATDQARQLLSDITNMLQNLEFQKGSGSGKGMPGMPGQNADNEDEPLPPEEQELTDAMKRLSDILREQRELNDDTLAQERGERPSQGSEQPGEGAEPGEQAGTQPGQQPGGAEPGGDQQAGNGSQPGDTPGAGAGEGDQADTDQAGTGPGSRPSNETLAERQARLGELVEKFAREQGLGETGVPGENALEGHVDSDALADIRDAQRRAQGALEQGNERAAAREQERATQLLSDQSSSLASTLDAMREARTGDRSAGDSTDPLGRNANGGGNNGDNVNIPDAGERQRAKDILDELRRRYNDADDEEEREYLRRLLERF